MSHTNIAPDYCGQKQPHGAHVWTDPPIYGSATLVAEHQCAGLAAEVTPGLCWHDSRTEVPTLRGVTYRCDLRAGHAGAHECDRNGGRAVWLDEPEADQ